MNSSYSEPAAVDAHVFNDNETGIEMADFCCNILARKNGILKKQ